MSDFNLTGLSSRSFEKLVQSISAQVLGPGTITFGDGPDGGREATFEGRMNYPSRTSPWDGYCVIQAKFLQRPKNAGADGKWALKQLEGELKKFKVPKRHRRKPEYYIFATNVVFSPVAGTGSKDKATDIFKKYQRALNLKGWAVWDYDEIAKFLTNFADIRHSYGAWITPGDVLAEVLQHFKQKRDDFLEMLTNYLAKEFSSDQYAKLEQAGHSIDDRVALSRVFVDLPASGQRIADPPSEEREEEVFEIVASILEWGRESLDPESYVRNSVADDPKEPQPGRYVLIGGPGQGKTTAGQFACQLFRAALLSQRPQHLLAPEIRLALKTLSTLCGTQYPSLPTARRFPIRVTLSEYAAALSSNVNLSLLAFVATQMERRTSHHVSTSDVRAWLSRYPWFLVLDGLDEVPASTNREEVLKRVEEFWIDAAQTNADVLVLATTRPQGYNDDFSPKYYGHYWLTPLSPRRAMRYAKHLVDVRFGDEPDRQQRVLTRLTAASQQAATAKLMQSPLQITIMAALVDQSGTPPQDRWRLFHDYYEVIYNREKERQIPAAELLREHKPDIDAIHHQVGLLLQAESEKAGGTDAKLSEHRFARVVTARLEEEEFSGPVLANLKERIIDAAANRLVFLVGLESGQVGFEIRSLQEYMAAEAVMTGTQERVQDRLRRFAPVASWRNVFLFAAGRCFLQEQHLRDTIHTICVELNDDLAGSVGRATLAGSILALDLLEEGVARRQPKYARLLAQCAVELIHLPPEENQNRLADVCDGEVETIIRDRVERELVAGGRGKLGVWSALLAIVGRQKPWAHELATRSWPHDRNEALLHAGVPGFFQAGRFASDRIEAVVLQSEPRAGGYLVHEFTTRDSSRSRRRRPWWMYTALGVLREISVKLEDWGIGFRVVAIDAARDFDDAELKPDAAPRPMHREWTPVFEAMRFSRAPSKRSLADSLRNSADSIEGPSPWHVFPNLPWVFQACFARKSREEVRSLADRVAAGALGDVDDWVAAEERWRSIGVTASDIVARGDQPFAADIATSGFPVEGASGTVVEGRAPKTDALRRISELLIGLEGSPRLQAALSPSFVTLLHWAPLSGVAELSAQTLRRLLRLQPYAAYPAFLVLKLARLAAVQKEWLDVLAEIGRTGDHYYGHGRDEDAEVSQLTTLYEAHANRSDLLPLLAGVVARGGPPGSPVPRLPVVKYEDYDDPRSRWAAVLLELGRGDLSERRSPELANATLRLRSPDGRLGSIYDAVSVILRCERYDRATEAYLLQLYKDLPDNKWRERAHIVFALNNSLRRRSSGVTDRTVWDSLNLSEKLFKVFEA